MKTLMKLSLSIVILLALSISSPVNGEDGCWPQPAKATTFQDCMNGGWVIRCDCGPGYCSPSQQSFCD